MKGLFIALLASMALVSSCKKENCYLCVAKCVKVTGLNSEGEAVTVELYRAFVTFDWTGNVGKLQDPVALNVHFNIMRHIVTGKQIGRAHV